MNEMTEQIMLGSLLGDGCCSLSNGYFTYTENHCFQQKDYILWKNGFLNFNVCNLPKKKQICIHKCGKEFKYYRDLFYSNEKKIISDGILNKLTPLALAVWYMDDGSYNYRNNSARLYTYGYQFEGNQKIQNWFFVKFGIECKIQKVKVNGHDDYFIRFNNNDTKKFLTLIKSYVIPSMFYKIGLDNNKKIFAREKTHICKKKYYLKNREVILMERKTYQSEPENKQKKKDYDKKYRIKNKEKLRKKDRLRYQMKKIKKMKMFTPTGEPICPTCRKPMKIYTPTKGRFKGQEQKYSWVCDCSPNLILSVG